MKISREEFEQAEKEEADKKRPLKERIYEFIAKDKDTASSIIDIISAFDPKYLEALKRSNHPIIFSIPLLTYTFALVELEKEGKIRTTKIDNQVYYIAT
ncbi:MAG: hypothetical protein KAX31_03395 [Thermoplasmata archaeon]|nr:hypothetical protein [Thermoplasmata archaeon]